MWTVVYMSHTGQNADNVRYMLEKSSMIVRVRTLKDNSDNSDCYEVLVPESEVQQALSLIIDANF